MKEKAEKPGHCLGLNLNIITNFSKTTKPFFNNHGAVGFDKTRKLF